MNEGNADRRGNVHRISSRIESTDDPAAADVRRAARCARGAAIAVLSITAVLHGRTACAQDTSMLDERVTQQSVADTICKPGYADTVSPPVDEMLAHKNRLLAQRGIDADDSTEYALDRRVPIVLGGSPDATSNLDLLPWGGHRGERRKE